MNRHGFQATGRVSAAWSAVLAVSLAVPSLAVAQTAQSLQFNGTNQYVTFGAAPSLGTSSFTIEVRFKRTGTGVVTSTGSGSNAANGLVNVVPLLAKGRGEADGTNVDCNYFLGLRTTDNVLVADYEDFAASNNNHAIAGTTVLQNNVWYHAAATYDGATFRLYLNGNLEASAATTAQPRFDSIQHASLATAMNSTGVAAGFFAGILDEARIWNAARSQTDIQNGMTVEIPSGSGLIGRWGLNEGTGLNAGNSVASGVNGTLTNAPTWSTDSTVPLLTATGLRFGGTNAYVTFGNTATLGMPQFTLETWFRRDGAGTATSTGTGGLAATIPLISKGRGEAESPANLNMNYFFGIDNATNVLCADFEDAVNGGNHPVLGATPITNGVWHHAAATYDGTTWRLYLDGGLDVSLAVGQTPEATSIQHAGLGTAMTSTGAAAGFFNGAFDEPRIWSVARSQSQIQSAMNTPLIGPASGLVARWGLNEDAGVTVASSAGTTVNGTITGANWSWAEGSPFNATVPSPPADPTGLTATAVSTSQIDLAWSDNSSNEASFEVERSTTGIGGAYTLLISLPAGSTSYSNTGLNPSTAYCYRVRAVNGGGASAYAGPTCATTQAIPPPAAPSNLVTTAITYGQIHLTWSDNSSDETSFELERSTTGSGGPFSPLATLAAGTTAYDDLNLSGASSYCYRVRAVGAGGGSAYAGPSCVTTPTPAGMALDLGAAGNTYASFGNPAALQLSQLTIEMWIRRDGTGTGTNTGSGGIPDLVPLVAKGRAEAEDPLKDINYIFGIKAATNVLCADFEEGAGGASLSLNHPVLGATPVTVGAWHHVAATYDGTWKLYLDGVLDATLAVNQPLAAASTVAASLGSALTSTNAAGGFFDGAIDEVRIWNVARSQSQLLATINDQLTTPQPNLVARWCLDEGTGVVVNGTPTSVAGLVTGANFAWVTGAPFNLSVTTPAPPSGLSASAPTYSLVQLTWSDNSTDETGFEIERSTSGSGGPFTPLATVGAGITQYADGSVAGSSSYCYRLRAVNGNGPSSYDGPACSTTPATGNTALDLGGSDAYASFGNPAALQLSTFTIEMWLRRDGPGVGTNTGAGGIPDAIPLLTKGRAESEAPAVDINYFLGIRGSDGVLCGDFEEGASGVSPSLNHPIAGVTPIGTGTWHHAAATYDGVAWKLYLDGHLEASLDVGQPPASASTVPVALGSALTSTSVAAGFFNGALDEVRIWDVARSQAEIQSTANAQIVTPTSNLVARWALDEGHGAVIAGSAGSAINGAVTGSAFGWLQPGAPFDLSSNHQPLPPVAVAPAEGATGVSTSPTLTVAVADPDGDNLTVTWYGRPVTPSAGPDFTLVGLPDTQYYTGQVNGGTNAIFQAQTNWIVANRLARNITYVAHLGDCTEHGNNGGNNVEWTRADASLSVLENSGATGLPNGIPFGVAVGNHDQTPLGDADAANSTDLYNQFFGTARFGGRPYYGGHYGANNDNWYDLFSASGMDFIVVSLEYDASPDPAVLAWADNLLTTYANRRAIVVSHFLINNGNPGGYGPQGQAIYDALKSHANLSLMLCGHVPGEGRRQDTFAGNTVFSLLSDYQGRPSGGQGWLRLMEFSPANNVIRVRTYSPWLDQYEADPDSSSQFAIPYNMVTTTPYQLIGTASGVPSGSNASITWPGLASGTAYEWYAVVSDGGAATVGSSSRFDTSLPLALSETHADVACHGQSNGSIDVTATGGRAPISLAWSDGPTSEDRSGLTAGGYSVTATDANGATASLSATIAEPPVLTASSSATTVLCNGGNSTVTVSASGGTPPYSGDGTFTVLAGSHSFTITDANGCTTSTSVTVVDPPALSASSSATAILCNGGNSTVTVGATGGTPPYAGDGTFTVLAGSHSFTITDANGCTTSTSVTVVDPPALSASSSATSILCNGGNSTVTVSASGGTPPYSGDGTFTVLAGTHNYTITDAKGCTTTTSVTVVDPLVLTASSSATTILCNGGNSTVTVGATGGTPPYTGDGTFTVLAGTHSYTITDANGCTTTTSVTVVEPPVLSASSSATTILCNGGNGTVTVTASGGTPPYSGDGTFTVLAGTHSYTITDANGCTTTTSVTVVDPPVLSASSSATAILCNGGNSAVTVGASGGTPPYSGDGTFTVLAGTHSFTITDANGCTTTTSVTVVDPPVLSASSSATAILCNGGNSAVTVTASGGTAPYTGAGTFTVLAGTHSYTITDANGCTTTTSVTVVEPPVLSASSLATAILCNGGNSTVTVTATGGTGPYTGAGTFTVLAGTHSYTITDANGCTTTTSVTVVEPPVLLASSSATAILCNGGNSTVTVTASAGTPPYSGDGTFTVLAGAHSFTITDANGCTTTTSVTVVEPPVLSASSLATAILCNGGNSTVTVTATGGTGPYTGAGTFTVLAGTHGYTITDANGCTTTTSVTVVEPPVLSASSSASTILCNGGNSTVMVTASGGTGPYTGAGTFTVLAGTHSFTITDANGCTTTTSVTVVDPPALNLSETHGSTCLVGPDGSVDLTVAGGTQPYSFAWSNGGSTEDLSGLTAGAYSVTVTDGNGCVISLSVTIVLRSYPVTASAGSGGSIAPAGAVAVSCGADQAFIITPDPGFQVLQVLVDGSPVGAVTTYTFTSVTASRSISATFVTTASALQFDGANQGVSFGAAPSLGASRFTLELWFKKTGPGATITTGTGGVLAIPLLTKGRGEVDQGDNHDMNYFLGLDAAGHVIADYEEGSTQLNPSLNHPVVGGTVVGNDVWHHAAVVFDGTSLRVYLDGSLDGVTNGLAGRDPAANSIQHAGLGTAYTSDGTAGGFFAGWIDEARVWGVARTQCEIIGAMNATLTGGTGLLGRWGLDEGTGTTAGNSIAGAPSGALVNTPAWGLGAPFDLPQPAVAPPVAPSALAAATLDAYRVELSWTDASTSEEAFQIERSTAGPESTFTLLASVGPDVTSYVDAPLTPQAQYCYRVRAVNCIAASTFAEVTCASTGFPTCSALDVTTAGGAAGGYVRIPNQPALQLSAFTLELWMRRDGTGVGTSTGTGGIPDAIPLISKGRSENDTPANNVNYVLGIRQSDGVLCADFEEGPSGAAPGASHPVAGSTPIPTGAWHHVAATYDGSTWTLYLDGNVEATLAVGRPACDVSTVAVALGSALNSTAAASGYFDGAIDEVRIWNVARTQAEIEEALHQSVGPPVSGLVGRWAFDEASGSVAYGTAGTGIDGTIIGTPGTQWDRTSCGSWVTGVEDRPIAEIAFGAVAPNPTHGPTQFSFALPRATRVTLEVHDVLGRRIAVVADRDFQGGTYHLTWNGERDAGGRVPAGMYFLRFRAGERTTTKSFVVLR